jgi:hypothetical protein
MTQSATVRERWAALPALPAAWEQKMAGRYDAALRALSEAAATGDYLARMDRGVASRRDGLLQLEVVLGLESPEEFQSERLALQVRRLKERFTSAASAAVRTAEEHLLAWCAEPGVADASDRQRSTRVLSAMSAPRAHARGRGG